MLLHKNCTKNKRGCENLYVHIYKHIENKRKALKKIKIKIHCLSDLDIKIHAFLFPLNFFLLFLFSIYYTYKPVYISKYHIIYAKPLRKEKNPMIFDLEKISLIAF